LSKSDGKLTFFKKSGGALISDMVAKDRDTQPLASRSGSAGVPIPQPAKEKAAKKGQGRGEKTES
jgi:hypothetical protein